MRKAIEKVIVELEQEKIDMEKNPHPWNSGWNACTELAISLLKEVLNTETTEQEQIRSEEDNS